MSVNVVSQGKVQAFLDWGAVLFGEHTVDYAVLPIMQTA